MLQYETEQPLATVLHKGVVAGYNRVFRLLWSMKVTRNRAVGFPGAAQGRGGGGCNTVACSGCCGR